MRGAWQPGAGVMFIGFVSLCLLGVFTHHLDTMDLSLGQSDSSTSISIRHLGDRPGPLDTYTRVLSRQHGEDERAPVSSPASSRVLCG